MNNLLDSIVIILTLILLLTMVIVLITIIYKAIKKQYILLKVKKDTRLIKNQIDPFSEQEGVVILEKRYHNGIWWVKYKYWYDASIKNDRIYTDPLYKILEKYSKIKKW